jgi:hypothetical protein
MSKFHRVENCLSMTAGSVLAASVGAASHWTVGLVVIAAWTALHGLTWGFSSATAARRNECPFTKELCS